MRVLAGLPEFVAREKIYFAVKVGHKMKGAGDEVLGQGCIRLTGALPSNRSAAVAGSASASAQPPALERAPSATERKTAGSASAAESGKAGAGATLSAGSPASSWTFRAPIESASCVCGFLSGTISIDFVPQLATAGS